VPGAAAVAVVTSVCAPLLGDALLVLVLVLPLLLPLLLPTLHKTRVEHALGITTCGSCRSVMFCSFQIQSFTATHQDVLGKGCNSSICFIQEQAATRTKICTTTEQLVVNICAKWELLNSCTTGGTGAWICKYPCLWYCPLLSSLLAVGDASNNAPSRFMLCMLRFAG
jgi:hypothetical protein